jgi:peptidyl-prolyl cis-trans isomerase A (cyclophilin A)
MRRSRRRSVLLTWAGLALVALTLGAGCGGDKKTPPPTPVDNPLLDPSDPRVNQQAPDTFEVKVTTSRGDFVITAYRAWAPHGVDRFYNLAKNGFYDDCRFFRVIFGFVAQFGISGTPEIAAAWKQAYIRDDPVVASNLRGFVSFAKPNELDSRTTQLFINYGDNSMIDVDGFAPIGRVSEDDMVNVVATLFKEYGDGPPNGSGPDQTRILAEGNAYLAEFYPQLDYIISAVVLP